MGSQESGMRKEKGEEHLLVCEKVAWISGITGLEKETWLFAQPLL
jgi:hypothetical protein